MNKDSGSPKPSFATKPLYLQVRDHFIELIASGDWISDQAIGAEVDLARSLNVSTGTVRKALDLLEADGYLVRRQGRGTFVTNQTSEELTLKFSNLRFGAGLRVTGPIVNFDVVDELASKDERQRLELGPRDEVFRCNRVRHYHGRRFMFETVVISKRQMPLLTRDDFECPRTTFVAAKRNNLLIGKAEERVDIAMACAEVASALSIEVGKPLLRLDRIIYSHAGRRLEWRLAYCDLQETYYMVDMR